MEIARVAKKNTLTIMIVPVPNPMTGSLPNKITNANNVPKDINELPMIFAFNCEKKDVKMPDNERMTEKEGRIYFWFVIYKQEISSGSFYTRFLTGINL